VSPDGRTLYVPSFEGPHWYVVDAQTGNLIRKLVTAPATDGAHNTIYAIDGSRVFMAGLRSRAISIADARTHTVAQTVGGFTNNCRVFTIDGAGALVYTTVNGLLGFEIGDVRTGKMIHRVEVKGFGWEGRVRGHGVPSHGVALSPDEKEIWVADGANAFLHVFDNTVMPPRQVQDIPLRSEAFWITWGLNGRVYPSSGDIIDAATKRVIGGLRDETGRLVESEKLVEVVFREGKIVRTVDQFGVGQVRKPATN
jgi:DNA-binding beta-propeller fold protein YncE